MDTVWPASVDCFILCLCRYQALQNMHNILELDKAKLSKCKFFIPKISTLYIFMYFKALFKRAIFVWQFLCDEFYLLVYMRTFARILCGKYICRKTSLPVFMWQTKIVNYEYLFVYMTRHICDRPWENIRNDLGKCSLKSFVDRSLVVWKFYPFAKTF